MTRFWRAVAKFAAKRAGLRVIKDVQIGSTVIWPTADRDVSWASGSFQNFGQTSSNRRPS